MKNFILFTLILFLSSCNDVGDNNILLTTNGKEKQPIVIVNSNRHINIAEFWLNEISEPNKVIMREKEIKEFNNDTAHNKKTLYYFKEIPLHYGSEWIRKKLLKNHNKLKKKATYFADGSKIDKSFYNDIKEEMNLDTFYKKKITTRFALTVRYTNQKIVPTEFSLLKKSTQIHFDRNQNSALDIGTAIAILHTSKDGLWHYGVAPTSSGWIRDKDIAFGDREEILNYVESKKFIVTISPKTPIMLKGEYIDYVRMGVKLPFLMTIDDESMVLIPTKDKNGKLILSNATVKTANTHRGYLPYTAKNILTQAFKFLHLPYGWGGMYGEQDCSKFIQEVYDTTGLHLPRNSASQSDVGGVKVDLEGLSEESREKFLSSSLNAGVSILHLKGHIVLYIGEYKGEPYIIHTVWGSSAKHFALGRTAVTSLNFHNYLQKIDKITNITLK